ncbi:cyclic nucleotide-gated cation channel beta-1-like [Periophthalmus magnuspinnatus]|uniref:cyclic nucleotide-gated cation channel beta-1-like n=1 Tax=Periophthalmus magnuspinnatus TaxID=409849 RepID=UPI0024373C54|nr:cyclic nucleotide-gated cation channel beta-1-like [Periophthalmus magnuspinnatus]
MIEWIKSGIEKVIPQPEHLKAKVENLAKNEAPPAPKVEAPPPTPSPKPAAEETYVPSVEQQSNVVGWIVNGIGRMLPQPVLKLENGDSVQNTVNSSQAKNDLVLEDLEQNNEKQEKPAQKEDKPPKKQSEDAEAQTEHPVLKDSIKKETEEAVLAQMEERLQLERLAAARAAEELALRAAEEAVRQLEQEHAAKIIIDSITEPQDQ